jgi:tRNA threonylcarbamoyl adenosine modification protein (Sua5/YciO/YrdC/YwlC family)
MAAYIVTRCAQLPRVLQSENPSVWRRKTRVRTIVSEYFELHPITPQSRLIRRAAEIVRAGGVIAYPTDSCYALGWHIGDKSALERVRRIRRAGRHHHFTLVCSSLAEIGHFARIDTWQFRLLKACLPGPYTFLLQATRETPRRLQHERRRTIGVRIPDHVIPRMLIEELGEPLMSSTLLLPDDPHPLTQGHEIQARLEHEIDAVLDGGDCGIEPTTVIDLSVSPPEIVRKGKGDLAPIMGGRAEGGRPRAL